jgi:hypothetical protein
MSYDESNDFSDSDESDVAFFTLILELLEKNSSRYESQAKQLIKDKKFERVVKGVPVKYKLDLNGGTYVIGDENSKIVRTSWTRFGWRKSSKLLALPDFFAKSEAEVQLFY